MLGRTWLVPPKHCATRGVLQPLFVARAWHHEQNLPLGTHPLNESCVFHGVHVGEIIRVKVLEPSLRQGLQGRIKRHPTTLVQQR